MLKIGEKCAKIMAIEKENQAYELLIAKAEKARNRNFEKLKKLKAPELAIKIFQVIEHLFREDPIGSYYCHINVYYLPDQDKTTVRYVSRHLGFNIPEDPPEWSEIIDLSSYFGSITGTPRELPFGARFVNKETLTTNVADRLRYEITELIECNKSRDAEDKITTWHQVGQKLLERYSK